MTHTPQSWFESIRRTKEQIKTDVKKYNNGLDKNRCSEIAKEDTEFKKMYISTMMSPHFRRLTSKNTPHFSPMRFLRSFRRPKERRWRTEYWTASHKGASVIKSLPLNNCSANRQINIRLELLIPRELSKKLYRSDTSASSISTASSTENSKTTLHHRHHEINNSGLSQNSWLRGNTLPNFTKNSIAWDKPYLISRSIWPSAWQWRKKFALPWLDLFISLAHSRNRT